MLPRRIIIFRFAGVRLLFTIVVADTCIIQIDVAIVNVQGLSLVLISMIRLLHVFDLNFGHELGLLVDAHLFLIWIYVESRAFRFLEMKLFYIS